MNGKKLTSLLTAICLIIACFAGVLPVSAEDVLEPISKDAVSAAILAKGTVDAETTQEEDAITVKLTADALEKHTNGNGAEGYWAGFAVAAPEGADSFRYAFGTKLEELVLGEEKNALETEVSGDKSGAAFYADAGAAEPKTCVLLQWYKGDEALSAPTKFVMDLSDVTLAIDYELEVIEAKIVDADNIEREIYDDYSIEQSEEDGIITVAVSMTGLKTHKNGAGTEGYWTGFAVAAPEGAVQMKAALGADADIALSSLIPVEAEVTEDGAAGVAFYTDASNASKYAKLQWFDENGNALSNVITFKLDLDGVKLNWIKADSVSAAVLKDTAEVVGEIAVSHATEATEEDGTISVKISTKELEKHANGNGAEGYWAGFAVVAPEGADSFRYAFGTKLEELVLGEEKNALETEVSGDKSGAAFYADAGAAEPKTCALLQWYKGDEALSAPTKFVMDLSGVTLKFETEYEPVVSKAKIVDAAKEDRTVQADDYAVEYNAEEGTVAVSVTELAEHTNGAGTKGYWTGFAVAAPEGATQMKAALGADADIALSSLIPVEAEVTEDGAAGVAFYTDASNASKYAKVQWFDESGNALSNVITFKLDLDGVKLNWIKADSVSAAVLKDTAEAVGEIAVSHAIEATEEDGTISVKISTKELEKHTNGNGAEGYWTGFAVAAPEGAVKMRGAFGTTEDIELGEMVELDADVAGETDGAAFYADAGTAEPKKYAKLQWFDENGDALSAVTSFVIDLNDVTLAIDYEPEVIEAKIVDADNTDREIYDDYAVEQSEEDGIITVAVSMTGLKTHKNGAGTEGYWTGFAVAAPEGATQMKAALGADADIELSSLIPVEAEVTEDGAAGVAFYTDASNASKYAKVQWFDESGNALSNVITFKLDLDGVETYKAPSVSGGGGMQAGGDMSRPAQDEDKTEENNQTSSDVPFIPSIGFTDVDADAWYYDAVKTAVDAGLMNGVSSSEFAPGKSLTRAMFVTILYRLDGEPSVSTGTSFKDVSAGQYYANAVAWASANGIVNGVSDDSFAPNVSITREQMAAIIYRYAENNEIEISAEGNVTYADSSSISEYAKEAVIWATNAGIFEGGADGTFAPMRTATRAEAAAIFVRLLGIMA